MGRMKELYQLALERGQDLDDFLADWVQVAIEHYKEQEHAAALLLDDVYLTQLELAIAQKAPVRNPHNIAQLKNDISKWSLELQLWELNHHV